MAKPRSLRRLLGDFLISLCAIAVVLAALVAMDERVREQLVYHSDATHAANEFSNASARARRFGNTVIEVVKDQSNQNRPLMFMLMAGGVLTVIMFRT